MILFLQDARSYNMARTPEISAARRMNLRQNLLGAVWCCRLVLYETEADEYGFNLHELIVMCM